jgi:hypothetical protein
VPAVKRRAPLLQVASALVGPLVSTPSAAVSYGMAAGGRCLAHAWCWPSGRGVDSWPLVGLGAGRTFEGPAGEGLSEMDRRQRELYAKQQQLLREQRSQDQERLLSTITGALPPPLSLPACLPASLLTGLFVGGGCVFSGPASDELWEPAYGYCVT